MEYVAHIDVEHPHIEDEANIEEVSLRERVILFIREEVSMEPMLPGLRLEERIRRSYEVHVAPSEGGYIAVFREMGAEAVRIAFEEVAGLV